MDARRILVVHRRSTYTELPGEARSRLVAELVARQDPLVEPVVRAHEAHRASMETVRRVLRSHSADAVWRDDLKGVDPDDFDLVVTIGGDGTVLHVSHAVADTPVLAVNSSPETSIGYLTAGAADDFEELLERALDGSLAPTGLYRMEVRVNGEVVTARALNDVLFCHECPASTSRYELSVDGRVEQQMSSGIWVATAAGSTAAIRAAGGRELAADSRRLQYMVREPFPYGGIGAIRPPELVKGFVDPGEVLKMRSRTTSARLYVDGPHVVFPVGFGDAVAISGAARPLRLMGYRVKKSA
ncbi:MAG: NAD(+)/NADH kinase [Polyangia bacterium]